MVIKRNKQAPIHFKDISIVNNVQAANEHTRAAVEALALAVKANAEAISAIASALKGGNGTIHTGIRVG